MNWWQIIKKKIFNSSKLNNDIQFENKEWFIEYQGKVIGKLIEPEFDDMFWVSYQLIPSNEETQNILSNITLWNQCQFQFRNKTTGNYAPNAIIAAQHLVSNKMTDKRISMRALY
ncbi:MAG: hypothetical protein AB8H03_27775 [Saprospiraceae bacterium]